MSNQDEKSLFQDVCLGVTTLADALSQGRIGQQRAAELKWITEPVCRGCGKPMTAADFTIWHTYWQAMWAPAHRQCAADGMKQEAHDCQCVDADCNDCRHYRRGSLVPLSAAIQKSIADGDCPVFTTEAFTGHCLKFDRATMAYPKKWTGRECFEHRRSV